MRSLVQALDRYVRARLQVYEYTDHPDCLFRARVATSSRPLRVNGSSIEPGAKVVEIHFWNERVPPVPSTGPDLGWAAKGQRMTNLSCRALAHHMKARKELADVRAVGGTAVFQAGDGSGLEKVLARLGFHITPHESGLGRFAEFWEEFYSWMIVRAFSVGTAPHLRLREIQRGDFWMSAGEFLERHDRPLRAGADQR
jgi:hypothetical protein